MKIIKNLKLRIIMADVIETKNLSVKYGQNEVLKDISFVIEEGDFVGLAGPNGAGKTTLVKAILGLLPVSSGKVELFGRVQGKFDNWGQIGYLPQKVSTINALFPATVDEVIALGLLSQKKWPKRMTSEDNKRVEEILSKLGILSLKKKLLTELSGGQQQKVLLARSLVSNPKILIFDEPSTALDPDSRSSFFDLVKKLNEENKITIILITHDTGYIGQFANKLLYIDKSLVYYGKFSEFCKSGKMKSYFGDYEQHLICHQHDRNGNY